MDFVILAILVVLLGILIWGLSRSAQSPICRQDIILQSSLPILVVNNFPSNRDQLMRYCAGWNYTYVEQLPPNINEDYVLFFNDPIGTINPNKCLTPIINIGGDNIRYIAFNGCKSYILKGSSKHSIKVPVLSPEIEEILNEGYPHLIEEGVLLHKAYFTSIFENRQLPFSVPVIMPTTIPPRGSISKGESLAKIPKIIHQTFKTRGVPENIAQAIYAWINHNLDYEYRYYDDHDQREYIRSHFDERTLAAYDSLIPGAYKADLWRYCVIYREGGVYIDVKMGPLVSLSQIIPSDTDLVIVNDTHDGTLYNAFFAATAKHPAILKTIDVVVNRVLQKDLGYHILYPTGPMAMGFAILPMYGWSNHAVNGSHNINEKEVVQVYSHVSKNKITTILDDSGLGIIKSRHTQCRGDEEYIHKITGLPHYKTLWNQGRIYR